MIQGGTIPEKDPIKTRSMVNDLLDAFKDNFKYTNYRKLTCVDVKNQEGLKKNILKAFMITRILTE